jgi:hypothetical protein
MGKRLYTLSVLVLACNPYALGQHFEKVLSVSHKGLEREHYVGDPTLFTMEHLRRHAAVVLSRTVQYGRHVLATHYFGTDTATVNSYVLNGVITGITGCIGEHT